jgi:putative transposase
MSFKAAIRDFVQAGVGLPTLWEKLQNQIYLGSEQFVQRMQKEIESLQALQEVPRTQRRPVAKPLDHYARHTSDPFLGMALAYLSGDYTMKAIADHFRVHYTTVSRAVKEYEATLKRDVIVQDLTP